MIKFSIEKIYHFKCDKCVCEFTIADFDNTRNKLNCPNCSKPIFTHDTIKRIQTISHLSHSDCEKWWTFPFALPHPSYSKITCPYCCKIEPIEKIHD